MTVSSGITSNLGSKKRIGVCAGSAMRGSVPGGSLARFSAKICFRSAGAVSLEKRRGHLGQASHVAVRRGAGHDHV